MTLNRFGHRFLRQLMQPGAHRFRQTQQDLESIQRQRLKVLLSKVPQMPAGNPASWQWEDFVRHVPVTHYADWKPLIEGQMADGNPRLIDSPVMRYQPTSGSSSAIKWIPYTGQFLKELDAAISPWLADLYARHPGIRQGAHYWSLSWLPDDMRQRGSNEHINDDMKLLSVGKRWLARHTQAVPDSVSLAATSNDSLFATLAYLVARQDLSAISVWSPTFALSLFENLTLWRDELHAVLRSGRWPGPPDRFPGSKAPRSDRGAALLASWDGRTSPEFFQALWPNLALVSAWDTATASPWARRLQELLPHADFQGKGLWATEGVITVPQGNNHVLAANSHVYEFEDSQSGDIVAPWQLERGQEVIPLMTTGSGLLRYRLGDLVRVTGYSGALPCLSFLGRADGVDMVGEKISTVAVQQVLDTMSWPDTVSPVVVLAAETGGDSGHPGYVLLSECDEGVSAADCRQLARELARQLENGLQKSFHYKLARSLGQLDAARCICGPSVHSEYVEACRQRGMIEGNIKVEALRSWQGALPRQFVPSQIVVGREVSL